MAKSNAPRLLRFLHGHADKVKKVEYGAFHRSETVTLELSLPRELSPFEVSMYIWRECGGESKCFPMTWHAFDGESDIFEVTLKMKDVADDFGLETGLFYFEFGFFSSEGRTRVLMSETDREPMLCRDDRPEGAFALTIYERKYPAPRSFYGGVIYHIFVDRFYRSGKSKPKDYAIMNDDWDNGIPQFAEYPGAYVANDMFFGGDLWGIIEKLDYIVSLGTTVIYLSPVFEAHSNHRYDTGDYETIDQMVGGQEALDALIASADEYGIKVIFDGVFNHTGSDSVYFNRYGRYGKSGAFRDVKSPYYKWFNFFEYPKKYECWWGIDILPRVNSADPTYIDYISGEDGIVDRYTADGIAGWRLDVVDELSDEFVDRLVERVHKTAKELGDDNPIVIGEVWEDASCKIAYGYRRRYFLGSQLDSVMNYPVRTALIEYLKNGNSAVIENALKMIWEHYPREVIHALMNLLGTHDTARIITELAADSPNGYSNAELSVKRMTEKQYMRGVTLVKLAYLINATIPGIPSVYYGDEVGMEGYKDPFNRMPFPWGRENKELLECFREIGKVRRENSAYRDGDLVFCESKGNGLLAFGRRGRHVTYYTLVNRSEDVRNITFSCGIELIYRTDKGVRTESAEVILPTDTGAIAAVPNGYDII